jgi:hypothetical protein
MRTMRLVLALIVVGIVALGVPVLGGVGTAEAQVWKIKKNKGTTTKTAAKRPNKTRAARASVRKKKRPAPKTRKVDLVPDEDAAATEPDPPREDEEPIFIKVEVIRD